MKRAMAMLLLWLLVPACAARAQQAQEITQRCAYRTSVKTAGPMLDGRYDSSWSSEGRSGAFVEITAPEDAAAHHLYICFHKMPSEWEIQQMTDGEWTTLHRGTQAFAHACIPLSGSTHVRFVDTSGERSEIEISELRVFGEGELPDWVQRWEPTCEKADLLVLVAHPDDELLFMGGVIPTYAGQRGLDVVVAYMTCGSGVRRDELLDGLWHMGLTRYPVFGGFRDQYASLRSEAYEKWGEDRVCRFVTELLRRYRPDVVVTHDVDGEYGHGAHRVCADMMLRCVPQAGDAAFMPESAQELGTWTVKKLYLHLYPEQRVSMNWREPLPAFGGKTSLELAQEAFAMHATQQSRGHAVRDEGEMSCAEFGLAYTTVGLDVYGDDFFEHVGTTDE